MLNKSIWKSAILKLWKKILGGSIEDITKVTATRSHSVPRSKDQVVHPVNMPTQTTKSHKSSVSSRFGDFVKSGKLYSVNHMVFVFSHKSSY